MGEDWNSTDGILRFPSGALVRGRGLRYLLPSGPTPSFAVYLLGKQPPSTEWEARWLRWPDFR
ncbi:protein phosphatase, partial [Streptomyces sp. NPDC006333]